MKWSLIKYNRSLPLQSVIGFALCIRGVQQAACRPHATQNGYECGPTQSQIYLKHYETFLWLHVAMYLMCGPRQLFFFQCGPEKPKYWTPLVVLMSPHEWFLKIVYFFKFSLQIFKLKSQLWKWSIFLGKFTRLHLGLR